MEMTSWDLAVLAESDYRRERLAEVYQRATPRPVRALSRWGRAALGRLRDGRASRRYARAAHVAVRDGGTPARRTGRGFGSTRFGVTGLGSTLDAVAARTDPAAWERQVTRRTAEISDALSQLGTRRGGIDR